MPARRGRSQDSPRLRVGCPHGLPVMTETPIPYRSPRAWAALLLGAMCVGIGLGMMIDANFGVAPLDAFFTALSRRSGLSVGVVLFCISVLMVLMSWALGLKPVIGTLVSFIGISITVDLTRVVGDAIGAPEWPIGARIAWWILGLLLFCAGIVGLFSSDLGASPYDQLVRSVAYRTGRSLGTSRLVIDAIGLLMAIILGGSWGIGTVVILVVVPLVLNRVLPIVKPHIHRDPLHDVAA